MQDKCLGKCDCHCPWRQFVSFPYLSRFYGFHLILAGSGQFSSPTVDLLTLLQFLAMNIHFQNSLYVCKPRLLKTTMCACACVCVCGGGGGGGWGKGGYVCGVVWCGVM